MKKGERMTSPVEPTEEYIQEFLKKRELSIAHSPVPTLAKDRDYKYLSSVFEAIIEGYRNMGLVEKFENAPTSMKRYTPKQMFDNAIAYIRSAIKAKQPLTITGLGLFMGFSRHNFFEILHRDDIVNNPDMQFIIDFATFIEMYDEYATHVKQNPAGPIFILKNFGWKDKFEIEATATQGALSPEERDEARRRMANFAELPEGNQ